MTDERTGPYAPIDPEAYRADEPGDLGLVERRDEVGLTDAAQKIVAAVVGK